MPPRPSVETSWYRVPDRSGTAIKPCKRSRARSEITRRSQSARFVLELFVGCALLAENLQDDAAKLAARCRKLVGHVGHADGELARQHRVRRPRRLVVPKVVALEDRESTRVSARLARDAETVDREPEEAAKPFAVEERIELLNGVAGVLALKLRLRLCEVEGNEFDRAASFQPAAFLSDLCDEAIETGTQIRPESAPRRIEAREVRLLVRAQEE